MGGGGMAQRRGGHFALAGRAQRPSSHRTFLSYSIAIAIAALLAGACGENRQATTAGADDARGADISASSVAQTAAPLTTGTSKPSTAITAPVAPSPTTTQLSGFTSSTSTSTPVSRTTSTTAVTSTTTSTTTTSPITTTTSPTTTTTTVPPTTTTTTTTTTVPPTTTTTTTTVASANHIVSIGDNFFAPVTISIEVGDRVTWRNDGAQWHTTTSGIAPITDFLWDSQLLDPGQSYGRTFDTPGSYPYFCSIHSGQIGTINVG